MSSSILETTAVPSFNDLVGVTFGSPEGQESDQLSNEVTSRIEDVVVDSTTGQVSEYVIAAPFTSDLALPDVGDRLSLNWLTPRGVGLLPVSFVGRESTGHGLRQWRVTVTGPPLREQRRRFVRVPCSVPTELHVWRDVDLLDSYRRRLADMSGVRSALKELPDVIAGRTLDLSEGSMLCASTGHVLTAHLPLTCHFTLGNHDFEVNAFVVWSVGERVEGETQVKSALSFYDAGKQADLLRPLLFRAQLEARRNQVG
jgi:hypothetical protein